MMLTVRFCAPCMPEPGSTMLSLGWSITTLNWAFSTSEPVVKVRSLVDAVAVGLMVMLAVALVALSTWKQFTVTLALKPVSVVPDWLHAPPEPRRAQDLG